MLDHIMNPVCNLVCIVIPMHASSQKQATCVHGICTSIYLLALLETVHLGSSDRKSSTARSDCERANENKGVGDCRCWTLIVALQRSYKPDLKLHRCVRLSD